jgi:hypothetical protein
MRRIGLCVAALMIAAVSSAPVDAAKPKMGPAVAADIAGKRLFDIGVADPDNDGWQDIFTANHKFESVFLRNHRGRSFRNEIDEIGLGPDDRFGGLELLRAPGDLSAPGVYIWPTDRAGEAGQLHILSTGVVAEGELRMMTRSLKLSSVSGADAVSGVDENDRPLVDFTIRPGGEVIVSSNGLADLPIQLSFADSGAGAVAPAQIRVGAHAVSPADRTFQIKLRDRHGLAFADVAGDRDQDVFVATGGLGGGIANPRYLGFVQDQLLVSGAGPAGRYANEISASGIAKDTCRGRAVSYADADGGGNLDLLTTCEGEQPRLHANVGRGGFVRLVSPPVVGRAYRWAQLDGGPPALLVTTGKGLEVWNSIEGRAWTRSQIVGAGAGAGQIALGDYDNSGTLDVLVTNQRHVQLLANRGGRLRPVRSRLGLPHRAAAAASFVDYDNDGWLDVSLVPQGLYRWDPRAGRYDATGVLRQPRVGYAIVNWMDYDNDGRRDPLIATSSREFSPRSSIIRRRNLTRGGRWLEIDLTGTAANREAIGAKVVVTPGPSGGGDSGPRVRRITQWVGQNDDARHSQGHYRLYFGLGESEIARRVSVHWPDGRATTLRRVQADRLLSISRAGRRKAGRTAARP